MKSIVLFKYLLFCLFPLTVFCQSNNSELQKMYDEDQASRVAKNIDWLVLTKQDRARESRVYELIKAGQIITGKDFFNSAMIFQHGADSNAFGMAVKHMRKAIEKDTTLSKWLLAAAIDRDLLSRNQPQIYGTQYSKMNGEKWKRSRIDTTQITDKERKYYHVETLAEQLVKERSLNLEAIIEFYSKSNSIKATIELIKYEKSKGINSIYNVSENELNSFGYELVSSKKENEALEIFKLNTELYPNEYNTFDSLGECLLLLNKREEGIKAYKKSLELNPKNENARKIISAEK